MSRISCRRDHRGTIASHVPTVGRRIKLADLVSRVHRYNALPRCCIRRLRNRLQKHSNSYEPSLMNPRRTLAERIRAAGTRLVENSSSPQTVGHRRSPACFIGRPLFNVSNRAIRSRGLALTGRPRARGIPGSLPTALPSAGRLPRHALLRRHSQAKRPSTNRPPEDGSGTGAVAATGPRSYIPVWKASTKSSVSNSPSPPKSPSAQVEFSDTHFRPPIPPRILSGSGQKVSSIVGVSGHQIRLDRVLVNPTCR